MSQPEQTPPVITIGLPVYNGEDFLDRALTSLRQQTYPHFKIILSDNGSTDRTAEICQTHANADPRIEYTRHPQNQGSIFNYHFVVDSADTPYFLRAAHDDNWELTFLEETLAVLEKNPTADICMTALKRVYNDDSPLDTRRFSGNDDPSQMSRVELVRRLIKGDLYHYWFYGLFRTHFIQQLSRVECPPTFGGDRLMMCAAATATTFAYVDKVLFTKTQFKKSLQEKYPGESFAQLNTGTLLMGGYWLAYTMLKTPLVPLSAKLTVPMMVLYYYWTRKQQLLYSVFPFFNPKWRKARRQKARQAGQIV